MLKQVYWQDFMTPWKAARVEQPVSEELQPVSPMTQTHAGAVHEGLQPLGMSYVGEVNGGLSPRQGTSHWNR